MDGTKMVIGGREFIVPFARMRASKAVMLLLRKLPPKVENDEEAVAYYDGAAQILVAGLKKNYPDLTTDELEDFIPGTIDGVLELLKKFAKIMSIEERVEESSTPGEAQGR